MCSTIQLYSLSAENMVSPKLSESNKTTFNNLKTFSLTKVQDVKYIIYTAADDILDIEPIEGDLVRLKVADLEGDKSTVDAFISMCDALLNN